MDRATIWEKYLSSKKLYWYLLSGVIMAVIYFLGYIFLFVIPAGDSTPYYRYDPITSEDYTTMDILTFAWSCFLLIFLWVPFFISLFLSLLGGNTTTPTDDIISMVLAVTPAIVGPTLAFILVWIEQIVYYGNKILNPNREKQLEQWNELVVANSKRLEQADWAIKKHYFKEAKRTFMTIRDSLNDFEESAEAKDLRKQIRKKRRQLALEGKIRDMDDFMTYTDYENTIEQITRFLSEKQYRRAFGEIQDIRFLLRTIKTEYKKYDLPVPSQLDDQFSEVDRLDEELSKYYTLEEK